VNPPPTTSLSIAPIEDADIAAIIALWQRCGLIPTARNCDSLGIPKSVKL
jgi:hypothetical protein